VLAAEGRRVRADPEPEKGFYYRSDHFNLAKVGVPMLYLKPGEDYEVGGTAAGAAFAKEWTERRYHQPSDEFEAIRDWAGMEQLVALYYRIGRSLAMSRAWPNWNEGDEFRGARDKSCGASARGC